MSNDHPSVVCLVLLRHKGYLVVGNDFINSCSAGREQVLIRCATQEESSPFFFFFFWAITASKTLHVILQWKFKKKVVLPSISNAFALQTKRSNWIGVGNGGYDNWYVHDFCNLRHIILVVLVTIDIDETKLLRSFLWVHHK